MGGERNDHAALLDDWINQEKAALELNSIIGSLCYDKSVELVFFRKQLLDTGAREVARHHLVSTEVTQQPLSVDLTLSIAREIQKIDLAPSKIDLGKLASEWLQEKNKSKNLTSFVTDKLKDFIGKEKKALTPKDVILFGFGRIGRLAAREIITQSGKGEQLRLKAIVTRSNSDEDIEKRSSLFRKDSVHGRFKGTVVTDYKNKALIVNGNVIKMIAVNDPATADYTAYGIDNALLIDNTGAFRDKEGLGKHLKAKGVSQVLLTAPGKGDLPNIVYGINHEAFDIKKEKIFTAASCTTNAISPVLKVINDALGVEYGHIETVHSYTNDQNLLDNYHKKYRRGRAAPLNMVITETGAASAVAKVLPKLKGKITGNSVRVPTPDVSLAILNLTLKKKTSKEEVNKILKGATLKGDLVEQIEYSVSNELVSSDLIGNSHASIIDSPATIVSPDGKSVVIYAWYDNEFGYTRQVFRLAKYIAGVRRLVYY